MVQVQLELISIRSIDTKEQTIKLDAYFRNIWFDWRLRYNSTKEGGCIPSFPSVSFAPAMLLPEIWYVQACLCARARVDK